jgi:hypothetical protein
VLLLGAFAFAAKSTADPLPGGLGAIRVPPLPAAQQPSDADLSTAKSAYAEASKLYYRGKLELALAAAGRAYRAVPTASTALVLATIHAETGRACEALDMLLVARDLEPTPDEESAVQELLRTQAPQCEPGWGWARFGVRPDTGSVSVRGEPVPIGRALAITAGRHTFVASAPGYVSETRSFDVALGAGMVWEARLEPVPVAADPAPPVAAPDAALASPPLPPPPEERLDAVAAEWAPDRTVEWSLLGSGLALLAAGGACLGAAVDAASDAEQAARPSSAQPFEQRRAAYDDAADKARALEVSGWVLGGAGAAALLSGAALWLFSEPGAPPSPSASVSVLPGGAHLQYEVRF